MKKKVILLTNIISPYRIPLFNYISKNGGFSFRVIALAKTEKNREWKIAKEKIHFDYKILPGWHLFFYSRMRKIATHLNWGVFTNLIRYNPDVVVIGGYNNLASWQALLYCKIWRKECILWNETTLLSASHIQGIYGLIKKVIIQGVGKYIACGKKAKEYLEYFGASPERIYISIDTVDVHLFYKMASRYRGSKNFLEERKRFPKLLLLYVGQLVKRKGIEQFLKVLNLLHDSDIGLLIVGSGPEEKHLKEFCREKKLDNVFFEGFHQQWELGKYYALADVFVLPSLKEVWGLVVNEALASGLFVLCSKYAGAAYDLINNENGVIFDPNNIKEVIRVIREIKSQIKLIKSRRSAIANWAKDKLSIEKSAESFIRAIQS